MLLELPRFKHIHVTRIEEGISQLQKYGGKAKVIAGGTDLLALMKDRVEGPEMTMPEVLINIKSIPEMNSITYDEEGDLKIGAAVTLSRLVSSGMLGEKYPLLCQAARHVGTTQLRNMGTLGGNLCQRPRCMYFRHPHFLCYKKGGPKCYAITGEHRDYHSVLGNGRCIMAHPSDMAPALVALKADVIIVGPGGEKKIPLQDFFTGPNHFTEIVLTPDEFMKEVRVPRQKDKTYQLFVKHRMRHSTDFALSSVSSVARISDGMCEGISIVLGGIAPFPYSALKAEQMVRARKLNDELITLAAEASVEGAQPLSMNRYKIDLTKGLVRRVLASLWHQAEAA
jgi:xanthine dehydrogenase YagS FAD-binding subunit